MKTRQEIINRYWFEYLRSWDKEITEPPNEERFWAWFCINKLHLY